MLNMKPSKRTGNLQQGMALIESLVAIVVLALGGLALLGIQLRTLADTQSSVYRGQAIRLIEDLSERMNVNPSGLTDLTKYVATWGTAPNRTKDCRATPYTNTELAAFDLDAWRANVKAALPLGDVKVFASGSAGNQRMLGVVVGWRHTERQRDGLTESENQQYKTPFALDKTETDGFSCPNGWLCHFQLIGPMQRCLPSPEGRYQQTVNGVTSTVVPVICPN